MFFSKKILSSIVLSTALIFSASANATEKSKEVDCRSYQELDEYYNCFTEQQEKYKKQLDAKVKK